MNDAIQNKAGMLGRFTTLAWLALAVVVVLADMETKRLASESLVMYRPLEVWPWLNMVLAHNYGAAFSFLSDAGGWQRWMFMILSTGVTLFLLVWLIRLPRQEWMTGLALSLIIGGAIGNLIDRVRLGYVVDFIDVHYGGWHWPAFNVADSAITCGVILLLLDSLLIYLQERGTKKA